MSLLAQHGFLLVQGGSPPAGPPTYIGSSAAVTQSSDTPTLSVPVGAASGDTVVVVLRCRADRSISGFSGWTMHHSGVVESTQPAAIEYARVYILSRVLASETSFSFTQSSSSAYGAALLVFRDGAVGNNAYADGLTVGITKASSDSILLAVGLGNNLNVSVPSPAFSAYTQRAVTYFFASPSYFYIGACETRSGVGAGSVSATSSSLGPGGQVGVWLAEIG